jgi:hypothetical protein
MPEAGDIEIVKVEGQLAVALSKADAFVCLAPYQERTFRPLFDRLNAENAASGGAGAILAQVWDDTAGHIFVAARVLSPETARALNTALAEARGKAQPG